MAIHQWRWTLTTNKGEVRTRQFEWEENPTLLWADVKFERTDGGIVPLTGRIFGGLASAPVGHSFAGAPFGAAAFGG